MRGVALLASTGGLATRAAFSMAPIVPASATASTRRIPAWRRGLPPGRWSQISRTSLSKLGVPSGNVDAWCGLAAIDDPLTKRAIWISAAGGGHGDSNDNGVYGIDWLQDTPAWQVICPPSAIADRVTKEEGGAGRPAVPYAHDGKPNSCHTYWSLVWCAQRARIFRPFSSALWYAAQNSPKMDGFDPVTGKWDSAGTWPNCPVANTQMLVAIDPATGDIYVGDTGSNDVVYRWAQAQNAWSRMRIGGTMGYAGYHGGVIDRKRKRLVRAGLTRNGEFLSQIPILDLATGRASLLASGITDHPKGARSIAHDYDADAYYLTDSANVYKLDPDTMAGTSLGPLPATPANGVLGRWTYFSAINAIVYYPRHSGSCWVMATQ